MRKEIKKKKKKEAPFGICFLPQGLVVPPVWGKAARKLRKAWHSLYSIEQIFLLWTRSYVWFSPNSGHTPPKWPVLDCLRERDRPHCRTARRHHCRYEGQQVHTELSLLFLPPVCVCVCVCVFHSTGTRSQLLSYIQIKHRVNCFAVLMRINTENNLLWGSFRRDECYNQLPIQVTYTSSL